MYPTHRTYPFPLAIVHKSEKIMYFIHQFVSYVSFLEYFEWSIKMKKCSQFMKTIIFTKNNKKRKRKRKTKMKKTQNRIKINTKNK